MEKKQEKEKRLHEGISVSEERSHFRGKKSMDSYSIFFFVGTLPLAWEKGFELCCEKFTNRNTPTCVGKRDIQRLYSNISWEHSRLRGKKSYRGSMLNIAKGTLPLAWEKDAVFMHISEVFAAICN